MIRNVLSNLIVTDVVAAYTLYSATNTHSKLLISNRLKWAIIIKYEGETTYTSNGKCLVADADHIMLLPKGASYEVNWTKAGHAAIIEFECDLTYPEPIRISVNDGKAILNQFKTLEYRFNLRRTMQKVESIQNLYLIILSLAKSIPNKYVPNHKQKKLRPALDYISQNFNQSISVATLAELSGMSVSYFRRSFVEVIGMPPIVYAKQLRIEKAKEMLMSDSPRLSDIAMSLGYSNLYDFSRDFKKHTGVSPSRYIGK